MYGLRNSELSTCYFNSVIKRVKQCCCTLILLPKSTLNANLTTTNRFFTNDDWQRRRFENFESDHQYESNLESDIRFEIESNHEASQVPSQTNTRPLCLVKWQRGVSLTHERYNFPPFHFSRDSLSSQHCMVAVQLMLVWYPLLWDELLNDSKTNAS